MSFNGVYSEVIGTTTQKIQMGPWEAEIRFVVVPDCSRVILGLPGLAAFKVQIDPARKGVKDDNGRMIVCQPSEEDAPKCQLIDGSEDSKNLNA